jgi:hypothetical protein
LQQVYDSAVNSGIKNLFYLEGAGLIGNDHEGTVDGTHLSDLGQYRIAEVVGNKIFQIINPGQQKEKKIRSNSFFNRLFRRKPSTTRIEKLPFPNPL